MTLATLLVAATLLPGFHPYSSHPDGGLVLRGVIPDAQAPQPLQPSYVYLPPGFTPTERYSVVYLLHGMPGTPGEYIGSLALERVADEGIASSAMRPFIAVVPAAADVHYNGEWAGPWERYVLDAVSWVDRYLPTIRSARGRVIAGLSAGGYGAFDIALRHPTVFGRVESWSGYFHPLHDGPFREADDNALAENDPLLVLRRVAPELRRLRVRFYVSTGPAHSHWALPRESALFMRRARRLGVPTTYRFFASRTGHWRAEFAAGLGWAFASRTPSHPEARRARPAPPRSADRRTRRPLAEPSRISRPEPTRWPRVEVRYN